MQILPSKDINWGRKPAILYKLMQGKLSVKCRQKSASCVHKFMTELLALSIFHNKFSYGYLISMERKHCFSGVQDGSETKRH